MELEEAKNILKAIKKNIGCESEFDLNILKLNRNNEEAIETVLQALDNSIPKEKVLAKIKDLDKIAKKKDIIPETVKEEKIDGSYVYSQRFNADGYIAEAIIKVLQELLEE